MQKNIYGCQLGEILPKESKAYSITLYDKEKKSWRLYFPFQLIIDFVQKIIDFTVQ